MSVDSYYHYNVYLGTWINWSQGQVYGATLTIGQRDANLLIAFVAFFVATVGTRVWRIGCLVCHYAYSSEEQQDGLHHQRQALLRNTANPETGILSMLQLMWAWRRNAHRPFLRILLPLIFSFVCISGIVTASGFSSRISIGTNEVLLSGDKCSAYNQSAQLDLPISEVSEVFYPYFSKQITNAANYAQQCYVPSGSRSLGCSTFAQTRLTSTVHMNASCPFVDKAMCVSQNANLVIDTGLLDSHEHFGVNAPPSERIQWRRVLHCAPIVTEGHKSIFFLRNESYTVYHYGNLTRPGPFTNATHTYGSLSDVISQVNVTRQFSATADYTVGVREAIYYNGSLMTAYSSFDPIPALKHQDADIHMIFLSAGSIGFPAETTDPWYKATQPWVSIARSNGTTETPSPDRPLSETLLYRQNEPASPLACTVQHQFCSPNMPGTCTALGSPNDVLTQAIAALRSDSEASLQRFRWFSNAGFSSVPWFSNVVQELGPFSLNSRQKLSASVQGKLPKNQWMIDVQYWNDISLALFQSEIVSTVAGREDPGIQSFYDIKPNSTEEHEICQNQKILSTEVVSFSVFGIAFVFTVGLLIIIISYALDPIIALLRKRFGVKRYQQLEWQMDEILQLQRLAYEEIGAGIWSKGADRVPITQFGDKLFVFDISNPNHPTLMAQPHENTGKHEREPTAQQHILETENSEIETVQEDAPSLNNEHDILSNLAIHNEASLEETPISVDAAHDREFEPESQNTTTSPPIG